MIPRCWGIAGQMEDALAPGAELFWFLVGLCMRTVRHPVLRLISGGLGLPFLA